VKRINRHKSNRTERPLSYAVLPLLLPLLTIWIAGCSSSTTADDEGRYPLWKIKGQKNTVWLLGSVHMLPESAHPLPEEFGKAYKDADRIVFEVDFDQEDMFASAMELMGSVMLPMGKTLDDVLEPETWELLEPRLDDVAESLVEMSSDMTGNNIPIDNSMLKIAIKSMKPWFVGFMLQQSELDIKEYRPDLGVDMFYMTKAEKDGKETLGLETLKEQVAFLEAMAGDDPDQYIRAMLEQTAPDATTLDELVSAWGRGDLKRLNKLMVESMKETPEIYNLLLVDRNRKWVLQIEDYLNDEEDYLVVVGAGHLVGEESVVALLRKRGIEVERI